MEVPKGRQNATRCLCRHHRCDVVFLFCCKQKGWKKRPVLKKKLSTIDICHIVHANAPFLVRLISEN
jgi:hypothetical protein